MESFEYDGLKYRPVVIKCACQEPCREHPRPKLMWQLYDEGEERKWRDRLVENMKAGRRVPLRLDLMD